MDPILPIITVVAVCVASPYLLWAGHLAVVDARRRRHRRSVKAG